MIPRRTVMAGGVLGSLGALVSGDADATAATPAAADLSDEMVGRIVQAIAGLRTDVQHLQSFADLAPVREAQLTFLRANGKFPDFIEVGTSVWFAVHDWHVRWQQPLNLGRDNLARYTILLNQTSLIMRTDVSGTFVGIPYDNR